MQFKQSQYDLFADAKNPEQYGQKRQKLFFFEAAKGHNAQKISEKRKGQKTATDVKNDFFYIYIQHIFPRGRMWATTILTYRCESYYNWPRRKKHCQRPHSKRKFVKDGKKNRHRTYINRRRKNGKVVKNQNVYRHGKNPLLRRQG